MSLNSTAGDAAADSYISVTDAGAYFTGLGITTWTGTTAVLENALRRGTQYLENAYRQRWRGITSTQAQALSWPRVDGQRGRNGSEYGSGFTYVLYDENGWPIDPAAVPVQVQRAAAEAALMYLTGVDMQPRLVRGGAVKSTRNQVDVIQEEIVYQDGASAIDRFTVIEGLLRALVTSTPGAPAGNIRMVRS